MLARVDADVARLIERGGRNRPRDASATAASSSPAFAASSPSGRPRSRWASRTCSACSTRRMHGWPCPSPRRPSRRSPVRPAEEGSPSPPHLRLAESPAPEAAEEGRQAPAPWARGARLWRSRRAAAAALVEAMVPAGCVISGRSPAPERRKSPGPGIHGENEMNDQPARTRRPSRHGPIRTPLNESVASLLAAHRADHRGCREGSGGDHRRRRGAGALLSRAIAGSGRSDRHRTCPPASPSWPTR